MSILDTATLDWEDFEAAGKQSRAMLAAIAPDRNLLNALFDRLLADPKLQGLCEQHQLLDYVVLYDDLDRGIRLRLHCSTDDHLDRPHNHRFSFSSLVLSGGYRHTWYGVNAKELEHLADNEARLCQDRFNPDLRLRPYTSSIAPFVIRHETVGSTYSLHHSALHSTVTLDDTVTLFLRGPAVRRASVILDPALDAGWWRFGALDEPAPRRAAKQLSRERIVALRERATRLSIL